jgi:hypothetical protein
MAAKRRRMSDEARTELLRAVEDGAVGNATEYAQEFAARHGLNPETVRSAISRLRRDLGLLERPSAERIRVERLARRTPRGMEFPGLGQGGFGEINAFTLLRLAEPLDPRFTRLAAAALIRYEEDKHFRRAVDEQRPKIDAIYRRLDELRTNAEELSHDERETLLRFLERD